MQTIYYDNEECFRAIMLVLSKNDIKFLTKKAFENSLNMIRKYMEINFNVNVSFMGENNFTKFTDYTKNKCWLFNNGHIAVFKSCEDELKKGIFHDEIVKSIESQECLSVFGLSSSLLLNYKNFVNKITDEERKEIKNFFVKSVYKNEFERSF